MTTIVALPSNASKWQMGFNSAFKRLKILYILCRTKQMAIQEKEDVATDIHSQFEMWQ